MASENEFAIATIQESFIRSRAKREPKSAIANHNATPVPRAPAEKLRAEVGLCRACANPARTSGGAGR